MERLRWTGKIIPGRECYHLVRAATNAHVVTGCGRTLPRRGKLRRCLRRHMNEVDCCTQCLYWLRTYAPLRDCHRAHTPLLE
jgi:hypothetical protein